MNYPSNSTDHRNCVLGISWPLAAIDYYPQKYGEPSPAMQRLRPILKALHDSLKVDILSAGANRDIKAACDAAAEHGAVYDDKEDAKTQYKHWLVIWFTAENAFADADARSTEWKNKRPDLWAKARESLNRISTALYKHHPAEESEGFKIWCCYASPYHDESLTSMWD